jgi:hypothetical protein
MEVVGQVSDCLATSNRQDVVIGRNVIDDGWDGDREWRVGKTTEKLVNDPLVPWAW